MMMFCDELWYITAAHTHCEHLQARCDLLEQMTDPLQRAGEAQAIISACEEGWLAMCHRPELAAQFAILAKRATCSLRAADRTMHWEVDHRLSSSLYDRSRDDISGIIKVPGKEQ